MILTMLKQCGVVIILSVLLELVDSYFALHFPVWLGFIIGILIGIIAINVIPYKTTTGGQ